MMMQFLTRLALSIIIQKLGSCIYLTTKSSMTSSVWKMTGNIISNLCQACQEHVKHIKFLSGWKQWEVIYHQHLHLFVLNSTRNMYNAQNSVKQDI